MRPKSATSKRVTRSGRTGDECVASRRDHDATCTDRELFTTALGDAEILTEIVFPIPKRFAYAKFANPASRFALVGVAIAETSRGVRVAVTGASGNGVFRGAAMEEALAKSFVPVSLANIDIDSSALSSDIHADAEYRAHLIGVMARRAVKAALV